MAPMTPVVCRFKESGNKFNGKLGEIRHENWVFSGSSSDTSGFYIVHFEDKGFEPLSIHESNLQVVFELPEELDLINTLDFVGS